MIKEILVFPFIWFSMFLWHELFHALGARVQGIRENCISVKFLPFPTMRFSYWGIPKYEGLISLSGGALASILSFLLFFITSYTSLSLSFFILGWVQLVYGIFEWKYIRILSKHKYDKFRYMLYITTVVLCLIFLGCRKYLI